MAPGDTLYVFREQQKFVALGALGTVGQTQGLTAQFAFEQERLSLNEAVAKAGGLLDARANPGQVFLYRVEYREALEKMGVGLGKFPSEPEADTDGVPGKLPRSIELLLRAGLHDAATRT